jgi:hypothetical protein
MRRIELAQRAAEEGWPIRRLESAIAKPPAPPPNATSAAPADDAARQLARRLHGQTIAATATVRATRHGFEIRLQAADRDQAEAILARLTEPHP